MHKYAFTVCTPAFDAEKTLHRVYESLAAQTFRNFEWIVIDDCSNDRTYDVARAYAQSASFPIRCYRQQSNRGKHAAVNRGVDLAEGLLFLIADADDSIAEDALEVFWTTWSSLTREEQSEMAGIGCLVRDQYGNLCGQEFPEALWRASVFDLRKAGIGGEKWGFNRTEVLREFPFPENVDKFFPEYVHYFRISKKYKGLWINKILRTWYIGENPDALSMQIGRYPRGLRYAELEVLNRFRSDLELNRREVWTRIKNYVRCSVKCGLPISEIMADINDLPSRIAAAIYLVAYLVRNELGRH
jgi:glycosyltransferase involved in cell wall biosynthesis